MGWAVKRTREYEHVHIVAKDGHPGGAPVVRVRRANAHDVHPERDIVLYWMIAARRTRYNFALDRAVAWARALGKPLVILEALRVDYPWASDRFHRFILDGMRDNEAQLERSPVTYYPYVELEPGKGRGLLAAFSRRAAVVVTDQFPCFFLPQMVAAAAKSIDAPLDVVDSNGLLPLDATDRDFYAAAHFRRYVQQALPAQLGQFPRKRPFANWQARKHWAVPKEIAKTWPRAAKRILDADASLLASLPIDHDVPPGAMRGGSGAAQKQLRRFVRDRLDDYARLHNEPALDATSRLSPYLHFGHISPHEIAVAVFEHEDWSPDRMSQRASGARRGWWGMREGAEAFLDQLIVWRELAYNTCAKQPNDYGRYASLPKWARATLEKHAGDPRPFTYSRVQLESATTHDPLWNAAQEQLKREGFFHNYMRMLWGKKILEWSKTPRAALRSMTAIMNRWSLDGRNPNSYAGYFWTLGRYDRPWPERAIYGKVRSMSSELTGAKVDVESYLRSFGSSPTG
jgi:deoxyribodipyrimidine photo-lyase